MAQEHTSFDTLLATARDLAITVVSGQLGPPMDGRMWIGNRALDSILCPDRAERRVAILIARGGPGGTTVHVGERTLDAKGLGRLTQNSATGDGALGSVMGCAAIGNLAGVVIGALALRYVR